MTAEEKETDIRLHSTHSNYEAVIELKLGDKRTAKDLINTINDQLVRKYMAPENRKAGALLVTLNNDKEWDHPDDKRCRIDVAALISLLRVEAKKVQDASGGEVLIYVHFLDLRARLPVESQAKSQMS